MLKHEPSIPTQILRYERAYPSCMFLKINIKSGYPPFTQPNKDTCLSWEEFDYMLDRYDAKLNDLVADRALNLFPWHKQYNDELDKRIKDLLDLKINKISIAAIKGDIEIFKKRR